MQCSREDTAALVDAGAGDSHWTQDDSLEIHRQSGTGSGVGAGARAVATLRRLVTRLDGTEASVDGDALPLESSSLANRGRLIVGGALCSQTGGGSPAGFVTSALRKGRRDATMLAAAAAAVAAADASRRTFNALVHSDLGPFQSDCGKAGQGMTSRDDAADGGSMGSGGGGGAGPEGVRTGRVPIVTGFGVTTRGGGAGAEATVRGRGGNPDTSGSGPSLSQTLHLHEQRRASRLSFESDQPPPHLHHPASSLIGHSNLHRAHVGNGHSLERRTYHRVSYSNGGGVIYNNGEGSGWGGSGGCAGSSSGSSSGHGKGGHTGGGRRSVPVAVAAAATPPADSTVAEWRQLSHDGALLLSDETRSPDGGSGSGLLLDSRRQLSATQAIRGGGGGGVESEGGLGSRDWIDRLQESVGPGGITSLSLLLGEIPT
jgi:hypothetical protein